MTGVLVAATAVLIGALWLFDRAAVRRSAAEERRIGALLAQTSEHVKAAEEPSLRVELAELRDEMERLPSRWEEIRNETKRHAARAYHHVKRVRGQLAEHGLEDHEIEQLAGELDIPDAEPSGEQGVLPLRADVEEPPEPTWEEETRRLRYGDQP